MQKLRIGTFSVSFRVLQNGTYRLWRRRTPRFGTWSWGCRRRRPRSATTRRSRGRARCRWRACCGVQSWIRYQKLGFHQIESIRDFKQIVLEPGVGTRVAECTSCGSVQESFGKSFGKRNSKRTARETSLSTLRVSSSLRRSVAICCNCSERARL